MREHTRDVVRRSALRWAAGLAIVLASCRGGGDSTGFGVSGSSGVGGAAAIPPQDVPPPTSSAPPSLVDVPMPYVACSLPSGDAGDDAETEEAGASDAGSPFESDAGDSPCSVAPPPDCAGKTSMVIFHPGDCDGERCQFSPELIACPGGCFRQMDGGNHCNE